MGTKYVPLSPTPDETHLDLSFENLCQELLALSASCTTLEKMISHTESQLDHTNKQLTTSTTIDCSGSSADVPSRPTTVNNTTDVTISDSPPPVPKRTSASSTAVKRFLNVAQEHVPQSDTSEVDAKTSQLPNTLGDETRQLDVPVLVEVPAMMVLPTEKLKALTIDVGANVCNRRAKIPPKNGLIRVTSPQVSLDQTGKCANLSLRVDNSRQVDQCNVIRIFDIDRVGEEY